MKSTYHTHIIRIGNSKGVRIPKQFLSVLGEKVVIRSSKEGILIQSDNEKKVPPAEKWEMLFEKAIAEGQEPEKDVFEDISDETDLKEWTWE